MDKNQQLDTLRAEAFKGGGELAAAKQHATKASRPPGNGLNTFWIRTLFRKWIRL